MKQTGWQLSAWALVAIVSLLGVREAHATVPPLPETFITQEGGWIRLEYPPTARAVIPELLDRADEIRADSNAALGRASLWRAHIRVAETSAELRNLAPEPILDDRSSAVFPEQELVVLALRDSAGAMTSLETLLRRELSYLALHEATSGNLPPPWFASGFAASIASAPLGDTLVLISATVQGRLLPLFSLDSSLSSASSAGLARAQAQDFVQFLRAKSPAAFASSIQRLREGQVFEAAIEGAYAESTHALEHAWRKRTTTRLGYLPVLSAIGFFGAAAFLLSGFRKARRGRKSAAERPEPLDSCDHPTQSIESAETRSLLVLQRRSGEPMTMVDLEVPKVEHDGRWHTLH